MSSHSWRCSSRTYAGNKDIHIAVGVLDNLAGCSATVNLGIGRIIKLLRHVGIAYLWYILHKNAQNICL